MKWLFLLAALLTLTLLLPLANAGASKAPPPDASGKSGGKRAPFYALGGRLYRAYGSSRPAPTAADGDAARRLWKTLHSAPKGGKKPAHSRPAAKHPISAGTAHKQPLAHSRG